ncbi:MAG: hypothetical protein ACR2HA_07710, partial [Nocardioides sp.]
LDCAARCPRDQDGEEVLGQQAQVGRVAAAGTEARHGGSDEIRVGWAQAYGHPSSLPDPAAAADRPSDVEAPAGWISGGPDVTGFSLSCDD